MTIVTLTTDFGTSDGFVGAMKGVLVALAPDVRVLDLTHELPPRDVRAGAWALRAATATFPPGTVHVGVVDPGVGTTRRGLLWLRAGQLYVGPDNGLFSWTASSPEDRAFCLDRPELFRSPVSATFHGRDVFASVAGQLAAGRAPERCGSPLPDPRVLPLVLVEAPQRGEVIHVDHFGNLISNVVADGARAWVCQLGARPLGPLRRTFGDVDAGAAVAYLGSGGTVEFAIRDGAASAVLGALGDEVMLWRAD